MVLLSSTWFCYGSHGSSMRLVVLLCLSMSRMYMHVKGQQQAESEKLHAFLRRRVGIYIFCRGVCSHFEHARTMYFKRCEHPSSHLRATDYNRLAPSTSWASLTKLGERQKCCVSLWLTEGCTRP